MAEAGPTVWDRVVRLDRACGTASTELCEAVMADMDDPARENQAGSVRSGDAGSGTTRQGRDWTIKYRIAPVEMQTKLVG